MRNQPELSANVLIQHPDVENKRHLSYFSWAGLVVLLVFEILALTLRFDSGTLSDRQGWVAGLIGRSHLLISFGVCAGTVITPILLRGCETPQIVDCPRRRSAETAGRGPISWATWPRTAAWRGSPDRSSRGGSLLGTPALDRPVAGGGGRDVVFLDAGRSTVGQLDAAGPGSLGRGALGGPGRHRRAGAGGMDVLAVGIVPRLNVPGGPGRLEPVLRRYRLPAR